MQRKEKCKKMKYQHIFAACLIFIFLSALITVGAIIYAIFVKLF